MDSLPDAIVQYILSHMKSARDVAACKCVSKSWKESMPFIKSLYFPRSSFDNHCSREGPDSIVLRMISSTVKLEELVVYSPFSYAGLSSWLSVIGSSLRHLELRMDSLAEPEAVHESAPKLDCLNVATNLESLKLWGVVMTSAPKWDGFPKLQNLEIVGTKMNDPALSAALRACTNLKSLLLLGCEGVTSVSIEQPNLESCKLDFHVFGNCSVSVNSPRIQLLEIQGCSWIRVRETKCLKNLTIANSSVRVYKVDFGKLDALESLSIRGVQWSWVAVTKILELASEVKHLCMKVEFTGDSQTLEPFPEIDLVDFFNSHPKLRKFDIHGAMFAALCKKNSLRNVDTGFEIPCLEEVVISVRSPLNAEQKMNTLESLIKYGKKLKRMTIKVLQMRTDNSSADDFFDEICKFRLMNRRTVRIE